MIAIKTPSYFEKQSWTNNTSTKKEPEQTETKQQQTNKQKNKQKNYLVRTNECANERTMAIY